MMQLRLPTLVAVFVTLLAAPAARAATFTVTTTAGGADVDDDFCSLREAINSANGALPNNNDCGPIVASPGGGHSITFNITDPSFGVAPFTITPSGLPGFVVLPAITAATTVDGMTQPGSGTCPAAPTPRIILDLSSYPSSSSGLTIGLAASPGSGSGSTLRGLVVNRHPFNSSAISIVRANDNLIECNFVGTDVTGSLRGAPAGSNQWFGITVTAGSDNVLQDNLVSGNLIAGIRIPSNTFTASRNLLRRNKVGTNLAGGGAIPNGEGISVNGTGGTADGNLVIANQVAGNTGVGLSLSVTTNTRVQSNVIGGAGPLANFHGIDVSGLATGMVIGTDGDGLGDGDGVSVAGPGVGERNRISGNNGSGVFLGADGVKVAGNWIGVDATGNGPLGNRDGGVSVKGNDNVVGTDGDGQADVAERNVIGDTGRGGVGIGQGFGVDVVGLRNRISGNYIGVGADGSSALVGNEIGVRLICGPAGAGAADGNVVGTDGDGLSDAAERNVISGNDVTPGIGVQLNGSNDPCSFQRVAGNTIGLDASGTAALPNRIGVSLEFDGSDNVVGTDDGDAAERNIISGNTEAGVRIDETSAGTQVGWDQAGNRVAGNWIGLDITGGSVIANGTHGVLVVDSVDAGGAPDAANVIGSSTLSPFESNVIVGHGTTSAVELELGVDQDQVVGYNYLGTNSSLSLFAANARGIRATGSGATAADAATTLVVGNRIYRNTTGVDLLGAATFTAGSLDNCIGGNTAGANQTGAPVGLSPLFTGNWWGDASGPTPFGSGDSVSPGILASPGHLATAPNDCPQNLLPAIGKAFLAASIPVNGTTLLTVTIGNPTGGPLTGVAFSDTLPAGLVVFAAPTQTGCGVAPTGAVGGNAFGLSGGVVAGTTCTVQVLVQGTTPGDKTNEITDFTASTAPTSPNSNEAILTVVNGLTLLKELPDSPTTPGGTVTLTITITNDDTHDASGIGFLDDLDAVVPGLTALGLPQSGVCGAGPPVSQLTAIGNTLVLTDGFLAAGASCILTVTLETPGSALPGSYPNTTSPATGTTFGAAVSGPPGSDVLILGTSAADVSMVKTLVTSGPFIAGQTITYSLLVANGGPSTATSVLVSDIPSSLTITGVSGGGCSFPLPCTIPSLPVGPGVTILVTATIDAAGAFDNSASAFATEPDGDLTNNTDSIGNGGTAAPGADVSMDKNLVTPGPYVGGQIITYTLLVANAGPSTATSVLVTEAPTNLTITGVSDGGCSFPLPCTLLSLAAGANVTITVTAQIGGGSTFDNSATVDASEEDPNELNNTDNSGNGGTAAPGADLAVVKTLITTGPYASGQTVTYSILITNNGPSPATTVQVTDTPTNLTITGVSGSGCAALPCTIASLASGSSTGISVTATIDAAGVFDNQVTVDAIEADPDLSNNTDSAGSQTAVPGADVSVVKTLVTPGPWVAGQTITYTLDVANAGAATATMVLVTDTPNPGLTITGASGGGCVVLPCTIPSLLANTSVTITVTATIDPQGGGFDNTATVDALEVDYDESNNTDNTNNGGTADQSADISVDKTLVSVPPYVVGQTITYTLNVANAGPSQANSVLVTDTPTNLTITSVAGGGCGALPCTIGGLASGASVTITVMATIDAAGAFDNSVTVDATQADPDLTNNTDATGNGGTAVPGADISVVKTLTTVGPYFDGQTITYTLLVANAGPAPATTVQVTDLPTNMTLTSASGGGCVTLPCTIPTLAASASVTITVLATIDAPGAFDNSAAVMATEPDIDLANNTDNSGNGGIAATGADVSVVKTLVTLPPFASGQTVVYSLMIANAGPLPASLVQVTDLPTNLTITSVSGTCVALPCTYPSIAAGASNGITVMATIDAAGAFDNSSTVSAVETDPDPSNNTDNSGNGATAVPGADVSVLKTLVTPGPYVAGQTVVYTLLVANAGPTTATSVLVTDVPTPGLTFTGVSGGGCAAFPCTISTLASGASVTITVTASLDPQGGGFDNTVTVGATEADYDLTNNTDNTDNWGNATPSADVSVVKSLTTAGPFVPGQTITYTLVVVNAGPSTATSVLISDTTTNLTIVSAVGGGCGTLPCTLGGLVDGEDRTILVTATIVADGGFDNSVTVAAAQADPDPTNNTDNTGNGGIAGLSPVAIPTTSEAGLMLLALVLALAGAAALRAR